MHPRLLTIPTFDVLGRSFGPWPVHTYGVLLALAFLAGLWVAGRQARRSGLSADYAARVTDMAIWVLIAGLVGAKLLLIGIDWRYFLRHPRELWTVLQSGGVFYGGLLAGILAAWFYVRRYQLPGWKTADALAPGLVLGQAIGRLGCFSAGCCWGKTTDVPWGVIFHDEYAHTAVGTPLDVLIHPTQLYESLGAFLVFAFLLWLSRRKSFDGQIALAYVGLYSALRFTLEFWRGDAERGLWFGNTVSTSQLLSLVLLLGAAVALAAVRRRRPGGPSTAAAPAA